MVLLLFSVNECIIDVVSRIVQYDPAVTDKPDSYRYESGIKAVA